MDIARWALKQDLPTSAVGIGGRFGYQDDGNTPNTLLTLSSFGDAKLLFEVRGLETKPFQDHGEGDKGVSVGDIIYGTEGFVAIGSDYGTAVAYDKSGKLVKKFKGSGSHFSNFVNAIKSHKQSDLNCPIVEGHYSAVACHVGNISYRIGDPESFKDQPKVVAEDMDLTEAYKRYEQHLTDNKVSLDGLMESVGSKLTFDPQAENFGSNAKANELLTREYRAPFVVPATL
jgi:hypothetical protein